MKNTYQLVILIIIGVFCLPVMFISLAFAVQTGSVLQVSSVSMETLKSKRVSIEGMSNIGEKIKTESLNNLDRAMSFLDVKNQTWEKSKQLSKLVDSAPARLTYLQAELKKTTSAGEKIKPIDRKINTNRLEQLFRQYDAEVSNARIDEKKWNDLLAAEQSMVTQTSEQMVKAENRLKDIQIDLGRMSEPAEDDLINQTRMFSLVTEQDMLKEQINLNQQRQRSHNLVAELYRTEKELASAVLKNHETMFKALSDKIQDRRQQEAVQAREDAQDAIRNTASQPKIIQDQFDLNISLSTELEKITGEEAGLAEKLGKYQSRLKTLEDELDTAKKRVDLDVLTDVIGMALRNQRRNLPNADQFNVDSKTHQIRMSEITERQIELDRLMRGISSRESFIKNLVSAGNELSGLQESALKEKLKELLTKRGDILKKIASGYDRIIRLIQDIEFTKKRLMLTAENFSELLDRHLLWIRSSKPISMSEILNSKHVLIKYFQTGHWQSLGQSTRQSVRKNPVLWILGFGMAFFLLFIGKRARKKLKIISQDIDRQSNDSFYLTLQAVGLTLLLSVIWPYLLFFPAISLSAASQTAGGVGNSGMNMIQYCWIIVFWMLVYNICRPFGLAQTHFRWPESVTQTFMRHLAWLIPVEVLSVYLLFIMETAAEYDYRYALGKIAVIFQCLALSLFASLILRFKKGITSILIEKYPNSLLCRLRYIWYPLFVCIPLYILWLDVTGYYYSAVELRSLFYQNIVLFALLIIFKNLALRILMLARRNIAFNKALAGQDKSYLEASDSDAADRLSIVENIAKLNDIDEQTRALLKLAIFVIGVIGTWAIWEPVFPAFGVLQDVHLWSYTEVLNGIEKTAFITLANVVFSLFVITTMMIAVRNLPGLIEVVLLNRLPMDAGARYAYTTVSRYAIIALGMVVALNSLGLRWSNLQWLVAALSVGLGFGLQEIVANFISGLIVLFERPFSVGDTVTIGDVTGTVTRIRIRATTIEDWDKKELIVPNKDFITGQLINWTLTDQIIRIKVPVGLAYGSDTDLAEELMLKAAENNSRVLKSPPPSVVFFKFGDNSLDYEIRVFIKGIEDWIPMLHAINRTINDEFNEKGIVIAFPQRDVHLDANAPLPVRVVPEQAGQMSSKQQPVLKT